MFTSGSLVATRQLISAPVRSASPICRGLTLALKPSALGYTDASGYGNHAPTVVGALPRRQPIASRGYGWKFTSSDGASSSLSNTPVFNAAGFTFAAWLLFETTPPAYGAIFNRAGTTGAGGTDWEFDSDASARKPTYARNGALLQTPTISTNHVPAQEWHLWVMTVDAALNYQWFTDGALNGYGTVAAIRTANGAFGINHRGGASNGTTGIGDVALWDRPLTLFEVQSLARDYWQIYAQTRRRLYFFSTGAGAVTATAAITEAPDALTSAASVSITASAQIIEAADSSSAAATVAVTATASIQEAADFLSASGGTAAFATAALVEGDDAITSAASVAITATSAIVELADFSTAAGTVLITAFAAITEQPDTIVADGGSASFATASLVEQADSLSSTGTVAVVGTAAITEAADLLASAATVSVTAIAAILEQADTLVASGSIGTVTSTADAAIVEAPDTAAATATVAVTGSAAIIEAGDIIVSGVSVLVTAAASITEQPDTLEASSAQVRFADAAIVEAPDYMTATVVQKIARRIAASDALAYGIAGSDSTAWRITPSDGLN